MPRTPKYGVPDKENPEWTRERFARAKRAKDIPEIAKLLEKMKSRGPQKAPLKKSTTIRLSPDVLEALRSTGPGWQTRVDEVLREKFVSKSGRSAKAA
jgi:uncharacterized protein (DUF4415 family)